MAGFKPHWIPHDHKLQSRGDFEEKDEDNKVRPSSGQSTLKGKEEGVFSDNDSTLVASSDGSSDFDVSQKKSEKGGEWVEPGAKPKSRRRLCIWIFVLLGGIIALGVIVALAVLFRKKNASPDGVVVSNSTTTVLSAHSTTSTVTPTPSTVTTTQTGAPQPTATAVDVEGFDVFQFNNGDIMLVYESKGSIWTKQFTQGSWTSPVEITSDAKSGTTVGVQGWVYVENSDGYDWDDSNSGQEYAYGLFMWSVFYVDTESVVQEMRLDLDQSYYTINYEDSLPPNNSNSWYSGNLGSFGYKVSDTSYMQPCAWGPLLDSETIASNYLYFDTLGGGITKLGYDWDSSSWIKLLDLPDPIAGSNKAITCATREDGIENLWLVNQQGDLEQWWLNANETTASYSTTSAAEIWHKGISITTPLNPNTSLTTWSTTLSDILIYQASNKTLMRAVLHGEAANTTLFTNGPIALPSAPDIATSGSRLKTGGAWSSDTAPFYIYFQNGASLMQQKMVPDVRNGDAVAAALVVVDAVELVRGEGEDGQSGTVGGRVSWGLLVVGLGVGIWFVV